MTDTTTTLIEYAARRARWVSALRNEGYLQAKARLRRLIDVEDAQGNTGKAIGYCCMGVMTDICKEELHLEWLPFVGDAGLPYDGAESSSWAKSESGKEHSAYMPNEVMTYLGMAAKDGAFSERITIDGVLQDNYLNSLAALNDDGGFNFAQIADVIEQNPYAIFDHATLPPRPMRYKVTYEGFVDATTLEGAQQLAEELAEGGTVKFAIFNTGNWSEV